MYTYLFNKIQTILDGCTTLAETHNHPVTSEDITGYPAVIYFPGRVENSFGTVNENRKVYRFRMYVIVSMETDEKTMDDIFKTILADAVDDVIDQFDQNWGDTIDSHRADILIDSGRWDAQETDDGKTAFAELNIRIKVFTNTN